MTPNKFTLFALFTFFIIFIINVHGQPFKKPPQTPLDITINLLKKSRTLSKTDTDSALYVAKKALTLNSENIQDSLKYIILSRIGIIFRYKGELDSSKTYYLKCLQLCKEQNDSLCMAKVWHNIAIIARMKGALTEAVQFELQTISIMEKANDSAKLGKVYNSLGNIYSIQEQWDKAIEYYLSGLEILPNNKDNLPTITRLQYNLGANHYQLHQFSLADSMFQLSLKNAHHLNNLMLQSNVYHSLGIMTHDQENFQEAERMYRLALGLQEEIDDKEGQVYTLLSLGELEEEEEQWQAAEDYYQRALSLSINIGIKEEELSARESLIYVLEQQTKWSQANQQWQQYNSLKDTLTEASTGERILEMQEKYETEKKTQENLLLEKENEINEKKLIAKNQKLFNQTMTISVLGVILLLAMLLLLNYRKRISAEKQIRRQQLYMSRKKMMDKIQEHELAFVNATLVGQETERNRIAADLHDGLSNTMVTVKLYFENLIDKLTTESEEVRIKYQEAIDLLDDLCKKARTIAHELSVSQSTFRLKPALQELVAIINRTDKLEVELSIYGLDASYGVAFENGVFHILRELIGNCLKHAEAKKLFIQLTEHDDILSIIVEDNGIGFDTSKLNGNGMGLSSLKNRINEYDGNMNIDSSIGRGTSITIELPANFGKA